METSASEPECSGDEKSRPIYSQPDPMVPALGVVGGIPGWSVRGIISIKFRANVLRPCKNSICSTLFKNNVGTRKQVNNPVSI